MPEPPAADPSAPAPSRTERRRARTRQALLSAARQLMSDRHADTVNVDEIADLADVAKGTFYNHFADKDALVREVERSVRAELERRIALANRDVADPARRMVRAFAALLDWSLADPAKARTLIRMTQHFADPDAAINAGVRRDVRAGIAAGRFRGLSDEAGVVLVISIYSGGVSRALDIGSPARIHAVGESLARATLVALGVDAAEAETLARDAMAEVGGPATDRAA